MHPYFRKEGTNIEEVLEAVVKNPAPVETKRPLKALIFDSFYDSYRAISYVRIFEGSVRPGMRIKMFSTGKSFEVDQVGIFTPPPPPLKS